MIGTRIPWHRPRALRDGLLFCSCLFLVACGSDKVRVYPVKGELFVNGKPAHGALIHLHPREKDKGRPAFATVQEDGTFLLTTFAKFDGAAAGDYAVTVNWYDERREDGETIYSPDKLQSRYLIPEKSGLTATIHKGKNELVRFDLK